MFPHIARMTPACIYAGDIPFCGRLLFSLFLLPKMPSGVWNILKGGNQNEKTNLDFRMLLTAAGGKSNLNQQRLEIGAGLADTGGFLLACAFCILGSQPRPGTKMFGSLKDGHVCTDFSENPNSCKGIGNPWNRQQQFDLGKISGAPFH